jgi:hypothetical protein
VASACASGLVCERFGAAACVDPGWAEWPMPNNTTIDVGAPNPESYTDNGDGTVTDNVTALLWQQSASTTVFTWGAASTVGTAQNYCATLTLAGFSGWRVPSLVELTSLIDPANSPAINGAFFPAVPVFSSWWTSTPLAGGTDVWIVTAGIGLPTTGGTNAMSNVRCVR